MREFHQTFREHFTNGLRPDGRLARNRAFLEQARSLHITEYGMRGYEGFTTGLLEGTVGDDYPKNNLFIDGGLLIYIDKDVVYEITNTSTNPWTAVELDKFDGRDPSTAYGTIAGDNVFHFAGMMDSWFAFNGTGVVFKTSHRSMQGYQDKVLVIDDVSINTGLHHRGRLFIGGFNPDDFWNQSWQDLFEHWRQSLGEYIPFSFDDIGSNYVMWSSIGGGDFPLWLFYPQLATEGFLGESDDSYDFDLDDMMLLEKMKLGQFGFMPMPWKGTIQKLVPMGNNVVVYGDNGVAGLVPVNPDEPHAAPTFGLRHISSVGAVQRGAVGGNERSAHTYIDKGGDLWTVSELQSRRVGHREFFFDLLSETIKVNFEEHDSAFYISGDSRSYLFDQGLTEINQKSNAVYFYEGGLVGFGEDLGNEEIEILTCPFDFGRRGSKVVTSILLGITTDSDANVKVALEYKNDKGGTFKRTPEFPVNAEGYSEIRAQGIEFKLYIKASDSSNFEIDYAEIRYQHEDKRFVRGTSTSQAPS